MIIFIDIDGTIADCSERQKFIMTPGQKKDWDSFHKPELVAADPPIDAARTALTEIFTTADITPIMMTGRPERLRGVTAHWLRNWFNIQTTEMVRHGSLTPLLMRPDKDYASSVEYKRRQISETLEAYPIEDLMFIDDDLRNKEMYQDFGTFLHAPACWGVVHF